MTHSGRQRRALAAAASVLAAVALAGCGSEPAAPQGTPTGGTTSPTAAEVEAAFYGDSYTQGQGASEPVKRWSSIICAERGWREFNPSVPGLGFIANRSTFGEGDLPDRIIEEQPDIVFVTLGLNDNYVYPRRAEDIHEQIGRDIRRLDEGLPHARLIVVEPFWFTEKRPESVEIINGWVREAAESAGADFIAGASHWMDGHPEWKAPDGAHPNDAGYAALASRMDEALEALGL